MNLNDSVRFLKGVGPGQAKKLAKLEIFTIQDLINHFPYRYDDFSNVTQIDKLAPNIRAVVKAKLLSKNLRRGFGGKKTILNSIISDGTATVACVWFNQPYLDTTLRVGNEYYFAGEVKFYKSLQFQSPVWELAKKETVHVGRIAPVYPLTAGVYPKWLRGLIKTVLDSLPKFPDILPNEIVKRNLLVTLDSAVRSIHFPESVKQSETARRRLAFDELLLFGLNVLSNKKNMVARRAKEIPFYEKQTKNFVAKLPFTLTKSQKQAAWIIVKDLGGKQPANRLLVGDVGSGKTIVLAIALLQALLNAKKAAVMAPTEILAQQHYKAFCSLPNFSELGIGLLTGSGASITKQGRETKLTKAKLKEALATGDIKLIIGTHAVIQDSVKLSDLAMVLVDEQHRFGVQQRALLKNRGENGLLPHFVSMSATPIPRTLALSLYGDLDICRITEMPVGRKPVLTKMVKPEYKMTVYREIEKELLQGRQAFVICPLIDPSDKLGVASATETQEKLQKEIFPKFKIGLLHGKMQSAEKEKVLEEFREKQINILVSTTVVEVGIDFPNATVMVVEAAERFGLAQLHQLRGRVGRSDMQSYCYLMASAQSLNSYKRLSAMEQYSDGFKLSEIDLQLRGPGDVYGKLQSGYPEFKIADVFDTELLQIARNEAEKILNIGLEKYPYLNELFIKKRNLIHPE